MTTHNHYITGVAKGVAEGMGYVITNYVDSSVKIQDDDATRDFGWLQNYLHEAMAGLDNKHDFESVYKVFNPFIEKYYFNELTPLNKYFDPFTQQALPNVLYTASAGTLQRVVDFESYAGKPSPTNEMAISLGQEIYNFISPTKMPAFNLTGSNPTALAPALQAYMSTLPPGRDCIIPITGTKADFRPENNLLPLIRQLLGITDTGAFLSPDASQLPIDSFGPLFGPVSVFNNYQPKCFLSDRFDPATMTKTELQVEADVTLEIFYCILKEGGNRKKLFIEIKIPRGLTAGGAEISFFTLNGTGVKDTVGGHWIPLKDLPKAPAIAEVSIWLFGMKGAKLKSVGAKLKNLFQTGNLKQNTRAKDIKDKYFGQIIDSMPQVIQDLFTAHFENLESLGTGSKRLGDLTYLLDAIMAQAIAAALAAGQAASYNLSPHGAYAIGGDKFAWLYNVHTKMTNSIFISKSDKIITMKVYLKPLSGGAIQQYTEAHAAYEAGIDTELLTKILGLFAALGITTPPTFSTTDLSGGKSLIIDAFNAKIIQWTHLLLSAIETKKTFFYIKTAVDATARNPAAFKDPGTPGATYTSEVLSHHYYGGCSKVIHMFGVIDSLCKSKKKIENWTGVTTTDEKKRWDGIFFEATNVVTDADTLVIDPDFGNYDDDYKTLGNNMFSISKVIDNLNKQIFNLNKQFQLTSPKILNIVPTKNAFKSSKGVIVKWFEIAYNAAEAIQCIRDAASSMEVVGGGKAIVYGPSQKREVSGVRDTGPKFKPSASLFAVTPAQQQQQQQTVFLQKYKKKQSDWRKSNSYPTSTTPDGYIQMINTNMDSFIGGVNVEITTMRESVIPAVYHNLMKQIITSALGRLCVGNVTANDDYRFESTRDDVHELCLYVQYIYENARELGYTAQPPVDDNYYYYILFIMSILRPNSFNGQLLMINMAGTIGINPDIELNPLLETTPYKIGGVSRRINKNKKSRKNKNNNKKSRKNKNNNKKSKKNKTIKKRKLF
jgi:hypothetical protein